MELVSLDNKTEFDQFFIKKAAAQPDSNGGEFLQSWPWGNILSREGEIINRIGVRQNGKIIALTTAVRKYFIPSCRRYFYYYLPRGPLGESTAQEYLLQELGRVNPGTVFVRIEPDQLLITKQTKANSARFKKTIDLQPAKTMLLDLSQTEESLLAAMHQKTRYNIRLAQKKGVKILPGSAEDLGDFWRLMHQTAKRDNFRLHDQKHYQNLLAGSSEPGFIRLFFAEREGSKLAAGLFCFWGDKVTYLHGASDDNYRSLMAPYALQWEIIKQAKQAGFRYYDFYGINEQKWPGVTRFKSGFSGREVNYPGTYDFIYNANWYKIYSLIRRVRRIF